MVPDAFRQRATKLAGVQPLTKHWLLRRLLMHRWRRYWELQQHVALKKSLLKHADQIADQIAQYSYSKIFTVNLAHRKEVVDFVEAELWLQCSCRICSVHRRNEQHWKLWKHSNGKSICFWSHFEQQSWKAYLKCFYFPIRVKMFWSRIKQQKLWGFHNLLLWALSQGPWRGWSRWFNTQRPPCVYQWIRFCFSTGFEN